MLCVFSLSKKKESDEGFWNFTLKALKQVAISMWSSFSCLHLPLCGIDTVQNASDMIFTAALTRVEMLVLLRGPGMCV